MKIASGIASSLRRGFGSLALLPASGLFAQQWQSAGTLNVPAHGYSFLAATPNGDLLAATFNTNMQDAAASVELPALLVRNPSSPNPEVVELCRTPFDAQRGYGGISCSANGSFFVSGDTGMAATSFVRKFNADGTPDERFGKNGEVKPGKRCLGLDTFATHVLVAVDWGQVLLLDAATGENKGYMPPTDGTVYMRDIAIDPKSLRVFGVAAGGIVTWGGGTPWDPADYTYRTIVPKSTQPRAGEGISLDPLRRTILITPVPGNILREIHGTGASEPCTVDTAPADAHLCDSVMSADGTTVYISDMNGRRIHTMTREMAEAPFAVAYARPSRPTAPTVPVPTWHRSYAEVVEGAREQRRPMAIYFRSGSLPVSTEFEAAVLKTDDFNRRAQNFVCVFEDIEQSSLLARRFGVYSAPYVCILDREGEIVAEFRHNVQPAELYAAMESVK